MQIWFDQWDFVYGYSEKNLHYCVGLLGPGSMLLLLLGLNLLNDCVQYIEPLISCRVCYLYRLFLR